MVTAASLKAQTSKDLAQQAKKSGVPGWHSMRKDQLVKALLKVARQKEKDKQKKVAPKSRLKSPPKTKRTATVSDSVIAKRIRREREREENLKNLAEASKMNKGKEAPEKDRLILVVRDAFWLQAYWEITKQSVHRAKVALSEFWHSAKPVIRLLEISSDGNTNSVENVVEEIEIHSGVNNWYLQPKSPGKTYRLAIGYSVPGLKFHLICKSNQVTPPSAKGAEIDDHWTDITNDVEKYYTLSGGNDTSSVSCDLQEVFEEKSRQPMNAPTFERLNSGFQGGNHTKFNFQVDAHMVVYGEADPQAIVTIGGEPVRLQNDGSFVLRLDMPDRRQVLPVVASSRDGTQQRTTVLAVERNTKVMEPVTNQFE